MRNESGKRSNPEAREDREIEHGHKIAPSAELIWGWSTRAGRHRARKRATFIIQEAGIQESSRVLEIGCGTGLFTNMVAETKADITALDLSEELLAIARKSCQLPNITFVQGNVERGEGIDGEYDAIYGSSILHHLDLDMALPHIHTSLKVGKRMVFTEPNWWNPQIWLERNVSIIRKLLHVSPDETAFKRKKLIKVLQRYGFVEVEVKPFDWLHPWTPSLLINAVKHLGEILENTTLIREISGSLLIVASKR